MRLLAIVLLSLLSSTIANVNIPWTNCGKAGDLLTVYNVTGNVWPPKKGAEFDINFNGNLAKNVNGGNYHLKVAFNYIPLVDKSGALKDLNVSFPIKSGPISLSKALTFPTVLPGGSYDITASATDENGAEIVCAGIKLMLATREGEEELEPVVDPTYADEKDVENDDDDEEEEEKEKSWLPMLHEVTSVTSVPVPWKNCGSSSDLLQLTSATANVWPPKKGSEFDVTINGTLSKDINGGNYNLKLSFDSIPLINKKGSLKDLNVSFPIKSGPISISEGLTFPSSIPSGTYDITASATDENNNEIACIQLSVSLKSPPAPTPSIVLPFFEITYLPGLANTPVSFSNCGSSSDLVTVNSLAADVWPPKKGTDVTLFIDATTNSIINGGAFDAKVSWDGIPITDQNGALSSLGLSLPIQRGAFVAKKTLSVPKVAPSGKINVKATANDDSNPAKQLFCINIDTKI